MFPIQNALGSEKKRTVLLAITLASMLGMSACATLRQFTALRKVDFSFERVTDVRLAGVPLVGKSSYADLGLADVARITAAIADREVPLDFIVQVRAENPPTNAVSARLLQLGWTFYLDEGPILDGELERAYTFEPGKPVLVPVTVSLDALDLVGQRSQDLFDLALAIAGVEGSSKTLRLDLRPTVQTDLGPITYPSPITIRRVVGQPAN